MKFDTEYFLQNFRAHPELLAFLNAGIDATSDYQTTTPAPWAGEMYKAAEIALGEAQISINSEPLATLIKAGSTKTRSIELERSMFNIMGIDADYPFIQNTPVAFGNPLTPEQFQTISDLKKKYFPDEKILLLVTKEILSDLGKIRYFKECLSEKYSIAEQDPDQFMQKLLMLPENELDGILPSFAQLSSSEKAELQKMNRVGFHYGWYAHAESTEKELRELQEIINEVGIEYLYCNFIAQLFDVFAASAHDKGKILLNEAVASVYLEDILPSLLSLTNTAPDKVYELYLEKRLKKCQLLPPDASPLTLQPKERLLARFLLMFRIYDASKATDLQKALDYLLTTEIFTQYVAVFNAYQANPHHPVPTYMPALLNALIAHPRIMELAHEQETNAQVVAFRVGLQLIAHALQSHQRLVAQKKITPVNSVSFNFLTTEIKNNFDLIEIIFRKNAFAFGKDGKACPVACLRNFSAVEQKGFVTDFMPSSAAQEPPSHHSATKRKLLFQYPMHEQKPYGLYVIEENGRALRRSHRLTAK